VHQVGESGASEPALAPRALRLVIGVFGAVALVAWTIVAALLLSLYFFAGLTAQYLVFVLPLSLLSLWWNGGDPATLGDGIRSDFVRWKRNVGSSFDLSIARHWRTLRRWCA
jgi:hypothetical protein